LEIEGSAGTMGKPDYIEVSRKAHELSAAHGWNAHNYAAKLNAEAKAEGRNEEHDFWEAVRCSLRPRGAAISAN
jgi:hypothetical protein